MRIEGYWRNDHLVKIGMEKDGDYPRPTPEVDWPDRQTFLGHLEKAESVARMERYRGFSRCRICKCTNGSGEYILGEWRWPSGFAHYLKEHGIRPTLEFERFILDYPLL